MMRWYRFAALSSSLPVRGAWVEIAVPRTTSASVQGRSPCGERGLKLRRTLRQHRAASRSPCGERGLKLRGDARCLIWKPSLPVRGAWVEIEGGSECGRSAAVSLPVRGAWVEMICLSLTP